MGEILSGALVPEFVSRYSPWADRWSGRDCSVMLNLGYGRIVDDDSMVASFVFGDAVVSSGVELHRRPEMWEICRMVMDHVASADDRLMMSLISSGDEFSRYDHPAAGMSFLEFLSCCHSKRAAALDTQLHRGLSAFSQGIVEVILERSASRDRLLAEIERFRGLNRIAEPTAIRAEIAEVWNGPGIYRDWGCRPLAPAEQDGHQLLVPGRLSLGHAAFRAIVANERYACEVMAILRALPEGRRRVYGNVILLCGNTALPLRSFFDEAIPPNQP